MSDARPNNTLTRQVTRSSFAGGSTNNALMRDMSLSADVRPTHSLCDDTHVSLPSSSASNTYEATTGHAKIRYTKSPNPTDELELRVHEALNEGRRPDLTPDEYGQLRSSVRRRLRKISTQAASEPSSSNPVAVESPQSSTLPSSQSAESSKKAKKEAQSEKRLRRHEQRKVKREKKKAMRRVDLSRQDEHIVNDESREVSEPATNPATQAQPAVLSSYRAMSPTATPFNPGSSVQTNGFQPYQNFPFWNMMQAAHQYAMGQSQQLALGFFDANVFGAPGPTGGTSVNVPQDAQSTTSDRPIARITYSQGPKTRSRAAASAQQSGIAQHHAGPSKKVLPVPQPTADYLEVAQRTPRLLEHAQPLLIVLDMNGTMVHRKKAQGTIVARPHLRAFVEYLTSSFPVMLWSSARLVNVNRMADHIFTPEQRQSLLAEWGRENFGLSMEHYNSKIQLYKHLTWIWKSPFIPHPFAAQGGKWDATNTVLIDDSLEKARSEPHNLIETSEFLGTATDVDETILSQILQYLEDLRHHDNVAAYMRVKPFKYDPGWTRKAA